MAALELRLEQEKQTISGLRSAPQLATRPTLPSPFASARLRGTSRWPTASPRDGASSSSPSLPRTMRLRSNCGSSSSPTSATSQPKSSISTAHLWPANSRSRLPRPLPHTGSAAASLNNARALALAIGRRRIRAATMADEAAAPFEELETTGASQRAASFGQLARRRPASPQRHCDGLGRPPSRGRRSDTTRFAHRCCCSKGGPPRDARKTRPRWMRTVRR